MIYLLHSTVPVGGTGTNSARHYLGWCRDGHLAERVATHRAGRGAKITRAFVAAGGKLLIVATWYGTRYDEARMHRAGHLARRCPICNPKALLHDLKEPRPCPPSRRQRH